MRCGKCRSNDTATFEMAHLRGSQSGRISGTVYEYDGGVEWHSGTMQMQTHLAQIAAPPVQPVFWSALMWAGFVLTILTTIVIVAVLREASSSYPSATDVPPFGNDPVHHINRSTASDVPCLLAPIIFIGGLMISTKLRNPSFKRETDIYQNQLANWQRSVVCLRCGNTWLL